MSVLITGIVIGVFTVLAFILLVEKLPRFFKQLVFGHYLASDILFTLLTLIILPITSATTMLAIATEAIGFTFYLMLRRTTYPWKRITFKGGRPTIVKGE